MLSNQEFNQQVLHLMRGKGLEGADLVASPLQGLETCLVMMADAKGGLAMAAPRLNAYLFQAHIFVPIDAPMNARQRQQQFDQARQSGALYQRYLGSLVSLALMSRGIRETVSADEIQVLVDHLHLAPLSQHEFDQQLTELLDEYQLTGQEFVTQPLDAGQDCFVVFHNPDTDALELVNKDQATLDEDTDLFVEGDLEDAKADRTQQFWQAFHSGDLYQQYQRVYQYSSDYLEWY